MNAGKKTKNNLELRKSINKMDELCHKLTDSDNAYKILGLSAGRYSREIYEILKSQTTMQIKLIDYSHNQLTVLCKVSALETFTLKLILKDDYPFSDPLIVIENASKMMATDLLGDIIDQHANMGVANSLLTRLISIVAVYNSS